MPDAQVGFSYFSLLLSLSPLLSLSLSSFLSATLRIRSQDFGRAFLGLFLPARLG